MTLKFYFIQTKVLKNESNLIESFKLPRILNSLKFLNYLIQTHSKIFRGVWIDARDNKIVIHDGHGTHQFLGIIQVPLVLVGSLWKLHVMAPGSSFMAVWVPNLVRVYEKVVRNSITPSIMTCVNIVFIYVSFFIIHVHLNSQDKQNIIFLTTHKFSTFVNVLTSYACRGEKWTNG